jgi:iron complex outermembrane receptor protein
MLKATNILILIVFFTNSISAQKDTVNLKEVEITSNRISLPFSKKSRSIRVITSNEIVSLPATNVADLLQSIAGVDVRRRGIDGMQSDLYIRGGNFDQTLVLIDGVKMDDIQTGHHTMNAIISLENIDRIEIIKGPAARIYGQNAFTGAINIVTKNVIDNSLNLNVNYGSFENKKGVISLGQKYNNGNILASLTYQESDGYRFNTDFQNMAAFVKSTLSVFTLTTSFTSRKFGANGFYASPDYIDQYEETQTSLVALSTKFENESIKIMPRLYWRRNEDMYLFLRQDPSFFRNLHISNKIGVENNVVINSNLGKTGIGLDVSRSFLLSNNLGDRNRTSITGFLEHRFEFFNESLDITPGVAVGYYSDFETKAFPGLDVGYRISDKLKLYGNIGYTYRVPTFTDMFYVGPTTMGNPNLEPESALSEELGLTYSNKNFSLNIALFNRDSDNLIDWTKDNEEDKWETRNFSEVSTQGFETEINYNFNIGIQNQKLTIGYSFIDDDIKDNNVQYTRYSLNSMKHQYNSSFTSKITSNISHNILYRYVERTDGESYSVIDIKLIAKMNKNIELSLIGNNIFNAEYTETNLVPMPKGNIMVGFSYEIY